MYIYEYYMNIYVYYTKKTTTKNVNHYIKYVHQIGISE
jgi:hypothetical protein